MKIAVYSLTRDRLDYTKYCFGLLKKRAGIDFDHFVLDNGSKDGTQDWLNKMFDKGWFKAVMLEEENLGISVASNKLTEFIVKSDYDLVIKFDNDCEVLSENILGQIAEVYQDVQRYSARYMLSPRVEGIVRQPTRGRQTQLAGRTIGLTAIIGGLFQCVQADVFREYKFPEDLPKAWGQDDHFCSWFKKNGGEVGYIEGLIVNHFETTDGQARRYPDYFKRKFEEEKRSA